jgi:hypothetical protein
MHSAGHTFTQSRLGQGQLIRVFSVGAHTKAHMQVLGALHRLVKGLCRTKYKTKSFSCYQVLRTRSAYERLVLNGGQGNEATVGLRGECVTTGM